jgi:hypothetical protein
VIGSLIAMQRAAHDLADSEHGKILTLTRSNFRSTTMKTFIKPIALLGLAGALTIGALASQAQARDAAQFTSANNASYYINGADAYETAPAYVAVAANPRVVAQAQPRAYESYAYVPQSFGAPVRPDDVRTTQQRHLDGTE